MKKAMFNDRYGLTNSVIKGYKKQTRSIEKSLAGIEDAIDNLGFTRFEYKTDGTCWLWNDKTNTFLKYAPRYKVGEVVAVAQSYFDIHREFSNPEDEHTSLIQDYCLLKLGEHYEKSAGWSNKMFASADIMPHQIRITNARIEQLQDISEENCLKDGISACKLGFYGYNDSNGFARYNAITPKKAYSRLIDDISGKGTWDSNPFVWVYDFELIK